MRFKVALSFHLPALALANPRPGKGEASGPNFHLLCNSLKVCIKKKKKSQNTAFNALWRTRTHQLSTKFPSVTQMSESVCCFCLPGSGSISRGSAKETQGLVGSSLTRRLPGCLLFSSLLSASFSLLTLEKLSFSTCACLLMCQF